jgi:molybdopterin-guanine dinucleotide biosynthesis protein A
MGGGNKALLPIGGRSIIERVSDVLREIFEHNIVITNSPEDFEFLGLPMFGDLVSGRGSLGGLYTGLKACGTDYGFLVACDMPFLNKDVISYMVDRTDDYDVIVPKISAGLEPLHGIYSRKCLPLIEELFAEEDLKIRDIFHKAKVLEIPEEELKLLDPGLFFLLNVNTPDDLRRALDLAKEIGHK